MKGQGDERTRPEEETKKRHGGVQASRVRMTGREMRCVERTFQLTSPSTWPPLHASRAQFQSRAQLWLTELTQPSRDCVSDRPPHYFRVVLSVTLSPCPSVSLPLCLSVSLSLCLSVSLYLYPDPAASPLFPGRDATSPIVLSPVCAALAIVCINTLWRASRKTPGSLSIPFS